MSTMECCNPHCRELVSRRRLCPYCRVLVYCSPECRLSHWTEEHQLACGLTRERTAGLFSLSDFDLDSPHHLGKGSFGEVTLVTHRPSQRKYALKHVILTQISKNEVEREGQMEVLKREICIHESLNHPNVVRLFDHFEDEGNVYLLMEWAEQGSLFMKLAEWKRLKEEDIRRIFRETCEGVKYLHDNNIIHRDLKPENLLVTSENHIKICDFGWCVRSTAIRTTFCGTLDYMAPEMLFGTGHSAAVDIWALGVLLYELSHGKPPFSGAKDYIKCRKIVANSYRLDARLSPQLADLISSLLRSAPEDRPSIGGILSHPFLQDCKKKDSMMTELQRISSESTVSNIEEKVTVPMISKIMSRREGKVGARRVPEVGGDGDIVREKEEEVLSKVEDWCNTPRPRASRPIEFMGELEGTSKKLEQSLSSLSALHSTPRFSSESKQLLLQGKAKLTIREELQDDCEEGDFAARGVLGGEVERSAQDAAAAELEALGEEYIQMPRQSLGYCDTSITPLEEELLNEDFSPCPFALARDSSLDLRPLPPQPPCSPRFQHTEDSADQFFFPESKCPDWDLQEEGVDSVHTPAKQGARLQRQIERLERESERCIEPRAHKPAKCSAQNAELAQRRKHLEELLSSPNFKATLPRKDKPKRAHTEERGFLRWIGSFLGCTERE